MEVQTRQYTRRSDLERKPGNTQLQPRDIAIIKALNYHGPLSVPYLYDLIDDDTPTINALSQRLKLLSRHGPRRLDRPGQRFKAIGLTASKFMQIQKRLTTTSPNEGLTSRPSISLSKFNFHHETFLAHITASMELGAREHDIQFVPEFEHLKRSPNGTRIMPCEVVNAQKKASHKDLHPDAYFALKDQDKWLALMVEADCATERLESDNPDQKAWNNTFMKYRHVISTGLYKQHLGISSGLMVLIVTTGKLYMEHMMEVLDTLTNGKGAPYFLFKTWGDFDDELHVPREVNYSLFEDPWLRVGHEPFSMV